MLANATHSFSAKSRLFCWSRPSDPRSMHCSMTAQSSARPMDTSSGVRRASHFGECFSSSTLTQHNTTNYTQTLHKHQMLCPHMRISNSTKALTFIHFAHFSVERSLFSWQGSLPPRWFVPHWQCQDFAPRARWTSINFTNSSEWKSRRADVKRWKIVKMDGKRWNYAKHDVNTELSPKCGVSKSHGL